MRLVVKTAYLYQEGGVCVSIIHGSANMHGTTTNLCRHMEKAFSSSAVIYTAYTCKRGCIGCRLCVKMANCYERDRLNAKDIQSLCRVMTQEDAQQYAMYLLSKVCIFITPIYFYSVPSVAKAFIDRANFLYHAGLISNTERLFFPILHAGSVRSEGLFQGTLRTLRYFAKVCGFSMQEALLIDRCDSETIAQKEDILEKYTSYIRTTVKNGGIVL